MGADKSRENSLIRVMKILSLCASAIIIAIFGFKAPLNAHSREFPFHPGEKLTFALWWEMIPAGVAVLEVLPVAWINGLPSYHFVMTAQSNAFIDALYKVRNRIDAFADLEMTRSILYKKEQREGSYQRRIVVEFDWEKKQAHYSNFGKQNKPIALLPGSFDPLSAFYHARLLSLKEHLQMQIPITDGKRIAMGSAKVLKRERLTLPIGTYDTYLVEPDIKNISGVFRQSEKAKIQVWVTADRMQIPVKIKSKVIVGSFVGELVSAEGIY